MLTRLYHKFILFILNPLGRLAINIFLSLAIRVLFWRYCIYAPEIVYAAGGIYNFDAHLIIGSNRSVLEIEFDQRNPNGEINHYFERIPYCDIDQYPLLKSDYQL